MRGLSYLPISIMAALLAASCATGQQNITGGECGNGIVEGDEECDDGNDVDGDGCNSDCTSSCTEDSHCADGEMCNGTEICDPATHECVEGTFLDDGTVCLDAPRSICLGGACAESTCGDGFVDSGAGESCEPPGVGGCSPECNLSCTSDPDCPDDSNPCNGTEYCDTGTGECSHRDPLEDGTECGAAPRRICISGTCQESTCGDGFIDTVIGEECEDGNDVEGDGCDNDCRFSCHDASECDDGHDCTDDACDDLLFHTCVNTPSPATTLCRPSAGDCDVQERCDGVSPDCPADGFVPPGSACRPAAGDCDVAETCSGASATCPADVFETSGTPCRAAAGDCDAEETCTGTSATCPADGFVTSGTVCRAAADLCDASETCTGTSATCPADGFETSGTVCRTASDLCDAAETCTGTSAACPTDSMEPPGTMCRAAAGDCDAEETCTGTSVTCPSDAFLPPGTVCRPALLSCDVEETCTGGSADCPPDVTSCTAWRRPITVDNSSNPSTLTDYQVDFVLDTASLVSGGKMRSDCGDVRMRDSDATTPLSDWVESGCNTASTLIWVKVPSIPASSTKTIYVYYGEGSFTSLSSLPDTFIAGSDWDTDDGFTFVESGTSESFGDSTGTLRSSSGSLSFVSLGRTNDTYVYQALPSPMTDGYAIRERAIVTLEGGLSRFVQPTTLSRTATDALTTAPQYAFEIVWDSQKGWNIVEERGSSYSFATYIAASTGTWYVVELTKSGSTATMEAWTSTYTSVGTATLSLSLPTESRSYFHPYLKRSSSWSAETFSGEQDWSLVRRYSSPEPTTAVGAEESA